MNTDSKLKRFVVILDKAPFVLFLKSANHLVLDTYSVPALKKFNLAEDDTINIIPITEKTALFKLFSSINKLPDPIAHKVIDALTSAIIMGESPTGLFSIRQSSVTPYIVSNEWQEHVEWQNVDAQPEPAPVNSFIITVDKFTHELSITGDANTALKEKVYEGVIHLESLDTKVPFPQALLKECTMEVYDIIIQTSVSRAVSDKTKSKYLSVMQTGHEIFNYVNLRQIEKDLKDILVTFKIVIENTILPNGNRELLHIS